MELTKDYFARRLAAFPTSEEMQQGFAELREELANKQDINNDGFAPYRDAVVMSLGAKRIDFAQLVKVYAVSREGQQRYSAAEIIEAVPVPIYDNPDPERICTSHIEHRNLTIRM